jgi:hypothetical protein
VEPEETPHPLRDLTTSTRRAVADARSSNGVPVPRLLMVDRLLPRTWLCRATLALDETPSGGLRVEAPLHACTQRPWPRAWAHDEQSSAEDQEDHIVDEGRQNQSHEVSEHDRA